MLVLACRYSAAANSAFDEDIGGWWQSWDSLLFVSVQDDQAQLFAAGILNPSLVKGELLSWSGKPVADIENPDPKLQSRRLLGLRFPRICVSKASCGAAEYTTRVRVLGTSPISVVDDELQYSWIHRHAHAGANTDFSALRPL